jgi:MFS family permease
MRSRWSILALLFAIRATMAFQFQSVAAVAPLLGDELGVSLADIGVLIGLYFAPGIVLALAGGAIGQKIGDKATVLAGLALMLMGGVAMTLSATWSGQVAGRLVAGTGGVLLNVLMTKMVTDWFAGKEIATAMAIFVNSWPFGLAISLLLLPPIGIAHGRSAVFLAVAVLIAASMLLLGAFYRAPGAVTTKAPPPQPLDRRVTVAVVVAGLIWTLYNVAFAMIFSFGPYAYEVAPLHSITSSARARIDGGMVRPSAFAVFRLMTSSNVVGCSTGSSAGRAPCKMRSTYPAARRAKSA